MRKGGPSNPNLYRQPTRPTTSEARGTEQFTLSGFTLYTLIGSQWALLLVAGAAAADWLGEGREERLRWKGGVEMAAPHIYRHIFVCGGSVFFVSGGG